MITILSTDVFTKDKLGILLTSRLHIHAVAIKIIV